jgi:hypothetical protein
MLRPSLLATFFVWCIGIGLSASAQPISADSAASAPFEPDMVQCDRSLTDTELRRQFPILFIQAIRRDACRCIKTAVGRPEVNGATLQPLAPAVVARCVNAAIPSLSPEAVPKSVTVTLLSALIPKDRPRLLRQSQRSTLRHVNYPSTQRWPFGLKPMETHV